MNVCVTFWHSLQSIKKSIKFSDVCFSFILLGALFDVSVDENQQMFQYAIEMANEKLLAAENFRLEGEAIAIDFGNELNISQSLCGLFEVCNTLNVLILLKIIFIFV